MSHKEIRDASIVKGDNIGFGTKNSKSCKWTIFGKRRRRR
jgi:hypothetical protein